MENENDTAQRKQRLGPSTLVALGALGGAAILAGWMLARQWHRSRRYADHAQERRQLMSLFTPGQYPRRRRIDRSGSHPLFERRQSVYRQY